MTSKPMIEKPGNHQKINSNRAERLTKLSDFLKSCRDRTKPETLNLPVRSRRRSPGLSRTEVATLAEISVDWYTWLEQGRDIRPSIKVIDRLATVFRLTQAEHKYLYTLTDLLPLPTANSNADIQILIDMIADLPNVPAFILRKDWQILAQNKAADELFGSWSNLDENDKNILYLFFTDRVFTKYLKRWEWHARVTIRQFRAIYGTEMGNPLFVDLIERLNHVSPQFKQWWAEADVTARDSGRKEFEHPVLGNRDYDYTVLRPVETQAVEVVFFVPVSQK